LILALLADIHANLGALEACLAHARAAGAERFALLGDLVGYAGQPAEVVEAASRLAGAGALCVKGNHDEAVEPHAAAGYLNESARAAIEWTRRKLDPRQKAFLAQLPLTRFEGDICIVHASAHEPQRWDYVDGPGAAWRCAMAADRPYTFCGHVHDQVLYFERSQGRMGVLRPTPGTPIPVGRHRRWVALVGSVGQPRDGNPKAAYALFDTSRLEITFHRVEYDHLRAAETIEAAGLPGILAYRMRRGV
jgi:diadenosine tetraphosphatase ApaH/serine/threonine PP2A family protein phosphatase